MAYYLPLCGMRILSIHANYEVFTRFERENGGNSHKSTTKKAHNSLWESLFS